MNYYQPANGKMVTRTLMNFMGLPRDDTVLAELGYYPVTYAYPTIDGDVEGMLPEEIQNVKGVYVQTFKVVEYGEERLQQNLARVARDKANEARSAADQAVAPYMEEFSSVEKQTWPRQQEEVRAYLADNSAPTPTLDGLAEARGISRNLMLEKAIAKVTAFEPISVAVVGRQQAYEDAIKAIANDEGRTLADRIKAIKGMVFSYDAPMQELARNL